MPPPRKLPTKRNDNIHQDNLSNIKDIQNFNNGQIYTKGFNFNTQAGTNEFPIVLGGKARKLHGVCFYVDQANVGDPDITSLVLNSEQLIDKVIWWNYNPQGAAGNLFKQEQYFGIPRALGGSDSCQLIWNAINAHKIYIVFFLSNA